MLVSLFLFLSHLAGWTCYLCTNTWSHISHRWRCATKHTYTRTDIIQCRKQVSICRWKFWRLKIKLLSTLDSRIPGFPWQWRTDRLRDKIWGLQIVIDSLFRRQGKVLWENELFSIQRMGTHEKKSLKNNLNI